MTCILKTHKINKQMKTLVHKQRSTEINVLKHEGGKLSYLQGQFFGDKPELGDYFMSHSKRFSQNGLTVYRVDQIITNRDARISNPDCRYSPKNAWFELELADVTEEACENGFDNSISNNL